MKNFLHQLFIPSEKNNYQAKILHTDFLTSCLVLIIAVAFLYQKTPLSSVLGIATDMSPDRLFQLTNEKRAEAQLSPLTRNGKLDAAAVAKGNDMFAQGYWAHFAPNGNSPWTFILRSGYRYVYAGENLCKNFMTSDGCFNALMASPTHRDNIMKGAYTEVGFGVVNGNLNGEDTTIVVQMFGTPSGRGVQLAKKVEAAVISIAPTQPVATLEPTIMPTDVPAVAKSENTSISRPKANIIAATQALPLRMTQFFLALLVAALGFDFYYAYKLRLVRMSGKHIAHFIFLMVIIVSVFIIRKGVIL